MAHWPGVGRDVLVFTAGFNSHGKRDATHAFIPEAENFGSLHGVPEQNIIRIDNRLPMAARAAQVLEVLGRHRGIVAVAFFCHGTRRSIQLGFSTHRSGKDVGVLAEAMSTSCTRGVIVPLYACSAADGKSKQAPGGDGGFADELRDALCRRGLDRCRVDAHVTVGHTTRNPNVRRFEGEGSPVGGTGGRYLVQPRSDLWPAWVDALREHHSWRFRFPFIETPHLPQHLQRAVAELGTLG